MWEKYTAITGNSKRDKQEENSLDGSLDKHIMYIPTIFHTKFTLHDVIKWKHSLRYWRIVRGIHWSPVNSPHKDQWRGACLICGWTNGWVNNRDAGDLRYHCTHYDVTVMLCCDLALLISPICVKGQSIPDSKVHGANMGPTWVLSDPDGPHEPCYQGCLPPCH